MSEKRKKIGFISLLIVFGLMLISSVGVFAKNVSFEYTNKKDSSDILSVIDSYQENYFEIIKRNDLLLREENDKTLNSSCCCLSVVSDLFANDHVLIL